ncbi:MAG TPA: nitrilase-related carbon-nitrogen hydrolase, partial [Psychromonas sp.]
MHKIAIVQETPVLLNRQKTIEKAISFVEQAAAAGAKLIVFPEAYIAGYPAWIWRLRPGADWGVCEQLHARLLNSAVDI